MAKMLGRSLFWRTTLLFFVIFLGLYGLYTVNQPLLIHYYDWLAHSVAWATGLIEPNFGARGNVISYSGVPQLRVIEGCDGITVFNLIIAAVLSFPKALKDRFIGVLILVPVLFGINWLRLLILAEIRVHVPGLFDFFHVYLFQPIMIFATFICFIIWILHREQHPSDTPR